jgi:cobalt-zinc-cadmium efflux system protein
MAHSHASPAPVRGGSASAEYVRALGWTLGLTTLFLAVEVAIGLWTNSLALLADAGHMLTDAGGLALALFAIRMARRPATDSKTYGYYRVEILAATANALVLLGISAGILYEAYRRFRAPPEVPGPPLLIVAAVGLAVNLVGVWLLRSGSRESLNVQGAYYEVVSDALGSLGVLLAGILIIVTGWRYADPVVGVGIGLFIVPRTWKLLRQAIDVLLEAAPPHITLADVERAMREVAGVQAVHDLHVWTLTSGRYAMSGHIVVDDLAATDRILPELHARLHERFGLDHTTIQPERSPVIQLRPEKSRERGDVS